ncbi:MAG: glycosyltransferase family 39 protein [Chloroflexota bacterium]|nr:glycosyltransferase family 39 protein [Chloroflexota bacterium]
MAVVAMHAPVFRRTRSRALADSALRAGRHLPLMAILALVIGIHVPTMKYYFFGDDFLVLGDIQSRAFPAYMRDVFLLRDLTPNWRPLTMLVYWGEFKVFGFNALPWRIVNLSLHVATVAVLYTLVLSMTKRMFVALAAAVIFAVSASAVHTVTYITAFPHVFSEFLLISSLFALHRYVESGERRAAWYWTSLLLFIAGFLANEGGVVLGAVLLVYFATASLARKRDPLDFAIKMLPFGLAATVLVSGLSGCGCQGVEGGFYSVGWHIPRETWVYMSRLAYPVGAIPKDPSTIEWVWGSIVIGAAIFFFIRGPHIARFAAVGVVIGVMPYVPGKIWTATRYTYMSLPFFAILVAVAAGWLHHHAARIWKPGAHALAAVALVTVAGLYSWQTIHQTQPFLRDTDRWHLLTDDLRANYSQVPPGTTIYVIDNQDLWSNLYWQPTWMTSVGHALYGKDVAVRALSTEDYARLSRSLVGTPYVLELRDGHLEAPEPAIAQGR